MPIFEFQCSGCCLITEKIVFSNNNNEEEFTIDEVCKECGGNTFEKIMSSSSFHLKGRGWYKDGYAKHGR